MLSNLPILSNSHFIANYSASFLEPRFPFYRIPILSGMSCTRVRFGSRLISTRPFSSRGSILEDFCECSICSKFSRFFEKSSWNLNIFSAWRLLNSDFSHVPKAISKNLLGSKRFFEFPFGTWRITTKQCFFRMRTVTILTMLFSFLACSPKNRSPPLLNLVLNPRNPLKWRKCWLTIEKNVQYRSKCLKMSSNGQNNGPTVEQCLVQILLFKQYGAQLLTLTCCLFKFLVF